jgi:hypothetical protein
VLVEQGLLATIEKSGFLGCGKHDPRVGHGKEPVNKTHTAMCREHRPSCVLLELA